MKRISKYISSALMIAAFGCAFTACDDWTEPESIDLDYGTIDKVEPVAYQKYLANLREYRTLPHKHVYTWFANTENAFGSQGHRISALPDSVDVIVLENPDKVTNQMVDEMYEARVNKGQQFSYCVSYDNIRAEWIAVCEELAAKRIAWTKENGEDAEIPAELLDPEWIDYMTQNAAKKLSMFNSVGFDRLMAGFTGKSTNHMTSAELKEYIMNTNAFLGIIADWTSRHQDVKFDLFCVPQYTDADLIAKAQYVFFSQSISSTGMGNYSFLFNMADGVVEMSKAGMVASLPDYSGEDAKLGYYTGGMLAIVGLGDWTAANDAGCVGTFNTADDYFLTNGKYTNVRNLIQTVNPSAK